MDKRDYIYLFGFLYTSSIPLVYADQYIDINSNPQKITEHVKVSNKKNYLVPEHPILTENIAPLGSNNIDIVLEKRISYLNWLNKNYQWPEIKSKHLIGYGSLSTVVPLIRNRLKLLDNKQFSPQKRNEFSADLVVAIKEFQRRHGLNDDGVVGPNTLVWLNMTPALRADLLIKNMSARKQFFAQATERYILINIPAFELLLQNKDEIALRSKVIVGKPLKPTPILTSEIRSVVLNPRWRVPRSIVEDDLLPKVRRNGDFFASGNFSVFNYSNKRVTKNSEEWQELAKGKFPYRIEQSAGVHNALGRYKLYFPNDHSVYLHDTSNKKLFDRDERALSSGCIRIDKVDDLTNWIADNLLGNKKKWNKVKMTRTKTKWFRLVVNLPVHLVYWTAWVDETGSSQFRHDIYGYN